MKVIKQREYQRSQHQTTSSHSFKIERVRSGFRGSIYGCQHEISLQHSVKNNALGIGLPVFVRRRRRCIRLNKITTKAYSLEMTFATTMKFNQCKRINTAPLISCIDCSIQFNYLVISFTRLFLSLVAFFIVVRLFCCTFQCNVTQNEGCKQ